jgi:hypothetical protein
MREPEDGSLVVFGQLGRPGQVPQGADLTRKVITDT